MDIVVLVILWVRPMLLAPPVLFWAYRRTSRSRPGRSRVYGLAHVCFVIGVEAVGAGLLISYVAHAGWIAVPHTVLTLVAVVAVMVGFVCLSVSGPALWANRPRRED